MNDVKSKTINDWIRELHSYAKKNGWWDIKRSDGEVVALVMSELGESIEAMREKHDENCKQEFCQWDEEGYCFKDDKPIGPATELVDAFIRIADFFGVKGWDFEEVLTIKHEYNKTRPYRHNKKW